MSADGPNTNENRQEIGKSPPRLMAQRAVKGRGRYVDDLTLPRVLEIAFVRSPFAHANIEYIDSEEAKALPLSLIHI